MRHVLPLHARPAPDRTGTPRRAARLSVTALLAAGLVACTLTPAQAAPVAATAVAGVASAATTVGTATTALTPFAVDRFDRTVTGGWGTSTQGGAWAVAGATSMYSVGSGTARQKVGSGQTAAAYLPVSSADSDVRVDVALTRAAGRGAGVFTSVLARDVVGVGDYRARLVVTAAGTVELRVARGTTTLRAAAVPGVTYAAGTRLSVRTQVVGTAPTTVRAKVWKAGTTEPSTWQVTATDSTAALQVRGRISVSTYQSGSTTPITASFSGFSATPTVAPVVAPAPAPPPPPRLPPPPPPCRRRRRSRPRRRRPRWTHPRRTWSTASTAR